MIQRIFSASFFSIVSRLFSTGTNIFVLFYISRFLADHELGKYSIAFFFFQLFAIISYLGAELYLSKEISLNRIGSGKFNKLVNEFIITIGYGLIAALCVFIILLVFYNKLGVDLFFYTLILGVVYGLERNAGGILLGMEKVSIDAFYNFLSFSLTISLILLFKDNLTIEKIFLIRIFAMVIGTAGRLFSFIKDHSFKGFNFRLSFFKESKFFWYMGFTSFLERHFDLFVLTFFINEKMLGEYFLSIRVYMAIALFVEIISFSLTPFISRVFKGRENLPFNKFLKKLIIFTTFFSIISGLVLFLSRNFLVNIFNPDLVQVCGKYLKILAFAVPFRIGVYIIGSVLSSSTYQKNRFYFNLFSALVFILILPVSIKLFSVMGALYAKLGYEILLFIIYLIFLVRVVQPNAGSIRSA